MSVPAIQVQSTTTPPGYVPDSLRQQDVLECRLKSQPAQVETTTTTIATSTPQEEYARALNFESDQPKIYVNGVPTSDANTEKVKNMMSKFMQKMNTSSYLYPGIALIVATLLLIIIIFQCTTYMSKILATIIYVIFVFITVYQNMR